ncbi:F-box/LRR-repeat protein At4g14103-like [Silene latifolia]|uniref:F-box/LRR-repeat protein At4g14103-like n=1 Tax=Silene latifolia TaxID=37657 RepID=UPI003D771480
MAVETTGSTMAGMDRKLKWQRTSGPFIRDCYADRLTSLPDEVLEQILSWLPTKDAAASQVLSKRMPRAFSCITKVDLDDSLISHCVKFPHLVERTSLYESFIDNVLHKLSQSQQPLTRFRLRFGGDKTTFYRSQLAWHYCKPTCFPNPEPARLYAWISYPLTHCGLRELDLSFHVRNPSEFQFPPGLFTRQLLEVLTLDSNLEINSSTEIPPICLPNLKILNLHSFVFNDHDFVTKLVSNCPALEDLSISYCSWEKADCLTISSQSLQRFTFLVFRDTDEAKFGDIVLIETPNLQYFRYYDNLPMKYNINMNALVEAYVRVRNTKELTSEAAFRNLLSLTRALSNVKYLSMFGWLTQGFYYAAKFKASLPMFRNLKTLKLGAFCDSCCSGRWDIVLLLILYHSPLLEELVCMEGFFDFNETCSIHKPSKFDVATLEAASWGLSQTIPSCCESHLKRIWIYSCYGHVQELNLIKFLLGKASVLKELVISMSMGYNGIKFNSSKLDEFKKNLEEIPRASKSCCIIYSDDQPDYNYITSAPKWLPQVAG